VGLPSSGNNTAALYATEPHHSATATTTPVMSTNIDNKAALCMDTKTFAPTLNQYLLTCNNLVEVNHPLEGIDFNHSTFSDIFINHLNDLVLILARGYNDSTPKCTLSKDQWLRTNAQLATAMQNGMHTSFPLDIYENVLHNLNEDTHSLTSVFARAISALNYYFTHVKDVGQWEQCSHCLKVTNSITLDEEWEATLKTCHQNVDTAHNMILNTSIHEFCLKATKWQDNMRAKARDQMVTEIIGANMPLLKADPRIAEWILRCAEEGHLEAESQATQHINEAWSTYDQQLEISNRALEQDLQKIQCLPKPSSPN